MARVDRATGFAALGDARAEPEPIKVEGAIVTQRITYTLPDGTAAAAVFRAIRRDPAPDEHTTPCWPIDAVYPADTS